ncbi:MAG TPA: RNA polymerase factor sigma-54 [Chitinophagaceae bacterium]|nr:RNA polymerase factor sigma-54 [Chitinophagaceae bacterium]
MLRQTQQQKLLQKLSPQQIQLMKLLQVPTANLEERLKEEMEENPALEFGEEQHDDDPVLETEEFEDSPPEEVPEAETSENDFDKIDISDYVNEGDEIAEYKLRDDNYPEMEESRVIPVRVETTFHDYLNDQLIMLDLDERERKIAVQVIGSIDDDGYLRRAVSAIVDDLSFSQNISATEEEVRSIIRKIQEFDPPGICCSDLRECLLIQLRRLQNEDRAAAMALNILENYFEEFIKKHYEKIQKGLGLSDADIREAIGQIIRLNPKPGGNYSSGNKTDGYIVPDFFVINNTGNLELTLNAKNAPDLRISEGYREMLKNYDRGDKKDKRQKEAVLFIKQKIDAAKWFIDAIKQRQHTLLSTMGTILRYQEDFFLTGDETTMKPMILKDIADRTNLDISTVSRVANSKYVQTEFGTYKLKYFFSESLSTDSGEEVSTREVKKILMDLIEVENKHKPLSDEHLTQLLKDKGYNIARRTVAKYREQLNIPVARLRKEL